MDKEIKELLEKNLELNEKIYKHTKYLKRHVIYSQIFSVIKILIIITPLILGYIYLLPKFEDLLAQYQAIMSLGGITNQLSPGNLDLGSLKLDAISPDILNLIK